MEPEIIPIVAATQYGDFKGTVSIDEADHSELLPLLAEKVNMPRGYCPVGFSIDADRAGAKPGHYYSLIVYAVDAQVAVTGQELINYVRQNDHVPVFEFRNKIELADFTKLMLEGVKRFSMVAATRQLERKPMVMLDNN